ncbi:hypothetical protein RN001_005981 [Aquatica leii]|uniref:Regulatory protein zeste n=1 Tax=Aquatica leii TaxID=1421715 RepID=A0AAN7SIB8_9COLE|nr:hypothetical protein RN001_005981 [Aquatica leii]
MRYSDKPTRKSKNKKLTVVAGKSVKCDSSTSDSDDIASVNDNFSESDNSDNNTGQDDSSDDDLPFSHCNKENSKENDTNNIYENTKNMPSTSAQTSDNNFCIGDWVVFNFTMFTKRIVQRKCIIKSCEKSKSDFPDLILHSFPSTLKVQEQWLVNIAQNELRRKSKGALHMCFVCNDHFEDICFQNYTKKKLNRGAVPTLKLYKEASVVQFKAGSTTTSTTRIAEIEDLTDAIPSTSGVQHRSRLQATGKFQGPNGKVQYRKLWEELTLQLNSAGLGQRTTEKWQKTWTDFKYTLKKKASAYQQGLHQTGGGPAKIPKLTELEVRILNVLGTTFYAGLADIKEMGVGGNVENPEELLNVPSTSKPAEDNLQSPHASATECSTKD